MTENQAKQRWVGDNHLEKWRTLYGEWVVSGTEAHGVVQLSVRFDDLSPFQQERLMHAYSHYACYIEHKPVNVTFL